MNSLGHYAPTGSLVHYLDPRVKLIAAVSLCMMILQATPILLAAFGFLLLVVTILSRLPAYSIWLATKPALPLPILILILHLFITEGTTISAFSLLHIAISYQGLAVGVLLACRFLLLYLSAILLTMTTLPSEIIRGMERLLKPLELLRIPTSELALMLSLALRFIPIIDEEVAKIWEAQSARGADLHAGNLMKRMSTSLALVIPLTFNTFRRAEELATAMEARGYQGGPRSYLSELTMKPVDYLVIVLVVAAAGYVLLS